ncbi:MAG: DUF4340 domain-containing protein [Deltaproteobacteria bacterium]|nr:DUF4340 domain-containing protein [Deltaproteobacteria bacterium]
MNSKVTIVALIIIGVAAVMYFMSGSQKKETPDRAFHAFVDPVSIKAITIAKGGRDVQLVPKANRWFVSDNNSLAVLADSSKVLQVFEFVNDSRVVQRITKKETSYANFEVTDDAATTLSLVGADGASEIFHIGKDKEGSAQFVRTAGDPYVYLVSMSLRLDMQRDSWFYNKVPGCKLEDLDKITYSCGDKEQLTLVGDAAGEGLAILEVPQGKQAVDLSRIGTALTGIGISKYLPLNQQVDAALVLSHRLHFKTGETVVLSFLKLNDEKSNTHYLEMAVEAAEIKNPDVAYLNELAGRYRFQLSWFDKTNYQKACDDFFKDKQPEAEAEGLQVQPEVPVSSAES